MSKPQPAANNQPNLNVSEKTESVLEQYPVNDPMGTDVPASFHSRYAVVPLLNKDKDELIEALLKQQDKRLAEQDKRLAEQDKRLAEQLHKFSDLESKREQADKTRTRLVESLLANFKIVMLAILALVFVASLGGSRVDKELIQHSIPLLLNMMTGLIGAVFGYYFSGNSKNNRS